MENNLEKICLKKKNKKQKKARKNSWKNTEKIDPTMCWRKWKNNDELKIAGVYVITDIIKDEVKSSIENGTVNVDVDDDNEQDRVIRFR